MKREDPDRVRPCEGATQITQRTPDGEDCESRPLFEKPATGSQPELSNGQAPPESRTLAQCRKPVRPPTGDLRFAVRLPVPHELEGFFQHQGSQLGYPSEDRLEGVSLVDGSFAVQNHPSRIEALVDPVDGGSDLGRTGIEFPETRRRAAEVRDPTQMEVQCSQPRNRKKAPLENRCAK